MYVRPKLTGLFATLATSAALLLSGCSSNQPRDINYGTDVGVGYVPPDGGPTIPDSAAVDGGASVDSSGEAGTQISFDSADALDVGISPDFVDAGGDGVLIDASIDGQP